MTARIEYKGGLRTEMTHQLSGKRIETDAPLDNNGRGEAFSPTDLIASAYISCLFTIIGIYCEGHGITFKHATANVIKKMTAAPRRIDALEIHIDFSGNGWDQKVVNKLLEIGKRCPVALSLHPEINIEITTEL
jgi:putative redox protein